MSQQDILNLKQALSARIIGQHELIERLLIAMLRDAIKDTVLQMAEEMSIEAGYAAGFKSQVYSALMGHIREKFLNDTSLGLAERGELSFAWKMLPQVQKKVLGVPGLIAGIIEYGDQ